MKHLKQLLTVVVITTLLLSLVGCKNTQSKYVGGKSEQKLLTLEIEGETLKFPMTVSEFEKKGFKVELLNDYPSTVKSGTNTFCGFTKNKEEIGNFVAFNLSDKDINYKDCLIGEVEISITGARFQEKGWKYNGITFGDSSDKVRGDFEKIFGEKPRLVINSIETRTEDKENVPNVEVYLNDKNTGDKLTAWAININFRHIIGAPRRL